jgi:hypothetical protein
LAFSGKSATAATVGIDSDFAYVKVVSSFVPFAVEEPHFVYCDVNSPFALYGRI